MTFFDWVIVALAWTGASTTMWCRCIADVGEPTWKGSSERAIGWVAACFFSPFLWLIAVWRVSVSE